MPSKTAAESKYETSSLKTNLDAAQAKIAELKNIVEGKPGGKESKTYARLKQFEMMINAQQKVMPLYDDGNKPWKLTQLSASGMGMSEALELKKFVEQELAATEMGKHFGLSQSIARGKGKKEALRPGEKKDTIQPRQVLAEFVETVATKITTQDTLALFRELAPDEGFLTEVDFTPSDKAVSLPASPLMSAQPSSALSPQSPSTRGMHIDSPGLSSSSPSLMHTPAASASSSSPSTPTESSSVDSLPTTLVDLRQLKGNLEQQQAKLSQRLAEIPPEIQALQLSREKLAQRNESFSSTLSVEPAQRVDLIKGLDAAVKSENNDAMMQSLYQIPALSDLEKRSDKMARLGQVLGWAEGSSELALLKKAQQAESRPFSSDLSFSESRILKDAFSQSAAQLAVTVALDNTDKTIQEVQKIQTNLQKSMHASQASVQKIDAQLSKLEATARAEVTFEQYRDLKVSLIEYQVHLESQLNTTPVGTDRHVLLKDKKEIVEQLLMSTPHEGGDEVKLKTLQAAVKEKESVLGQDQTSEESAGWQKIRGQLSDSTKRGTSPGEPTSPQQQTMESFDRLRAQSSSRGADSESTPAVSLRR